MTFGERLKLALKEHDLNQREFGEKVGICTNFIWRVCNDKKTPSLESLKKILYGLPMTNARWLIVGFDPSFDAWMESQKEFQQERKEENEVQ